MNILPAGIEDKINRIDRQRSLYIGISSGILAVWCAYRLFWALYVMLTFGWGFGSLIVSFVVWGLIGVVAAATAVGFLTRYAKRP